MNVISRDEFREGVFKRDKHLCVMCKGHAVDAHHIMERRLFSNGGYFLENGASLCEQLHLEAEMTLLSPNDIRLAANINCIVLPDHLYLDVEYDKWGNEILANGERVKGELFNDESVQKILKEGNVLGLFTNRIKYPRTYHLPWSPGMNRDDRMIEDAAQFEGKEVIITEKMDGENSTLYSDYTHARSINSGSHPSRNWLKNFWAQLCYNIPTDWRICGENLYAKHAIQYSKENGNALNSYFYMFSIWDEKNICLSWEETETWAILLEIPLVPIIYKGIWDIKVINELNKKMDQNIGTVEGYVVRITDEFHYSQFRHSVAKYVRKNHNVNNHGKWSQSKIIKNEIV